MRQFTTGDLNKQVGNVTDAASPWFSPSTGNPASC